jgi:PAS domain S-box-containing protein
LRLAALHACPVGIFHTDARGQLIYGNPEMARIFGRSAESLMGDDWVESVHPDDREQVVARWQQAAAAGEVFDHIYRVRHADGSVMHVRVRAQAVRLPDGSAGGYVGSVEGKGSRFTVTVPVLRGEEPPAPSLWVDLGPVAERARVLIAEDNTTNQVATPSRATASAASRPE